MEQIPINFGDDGIDPLFPYGHGITSLENSPVGSDPVFYSASVSSDGKKIESNFNKIITLGISSPSDFIIKVNDQIMIVDSLIVKENDPKTIILYMSASVGEGDLVTIEYTGSAIQSHDGGILQPFGPEGVYNLLSDIGFSYIVPAHIEAEDYYDMSGIATETCYDVGGGLNVGWIDQGDWLSYRIDVSQTTTYPFVFRVASESTGGMITLYQDSAPIASVTIPVTGGWQSWQSVDFSAILYAGTSTLKLYAEQGGFNINWLKIEQVTDIEGVNIIPSDITLFSNYPNPFNPETTIRYYLPSATHVEIEVFSASGEKVGAIDSGLKIKGFHTAKFKAEDLASGIYFYRLTTSHFQKIRKMMLIK